MKDSLWLKESTLPSFPSLEEDLRVDVLIVGGGMAGILCAYQLHQKGISHALIEAETILGGVTGNTTAKITSQHGLCYHKLLKQFDEKTAKGYYQIHQEAIRQYEALASKIDCDFLRTNHYVYETGTPGELEKEMQALQKLGIPVVYTETVGIPVKTSGAIGFLHQAQFDPVKFIAGIVKDLPIYEHTKAQEFVGNTVKTGRCRIHARKIILATHFPILNKHGGYFLKLYQQRSYVVALENAGKVEGMYLGEGKEGLSFRNAGDLLLLGGGSCRTGKKSCGWQMLEQKAKQLYPGAAVKYRWATQDCMSLDGIPYIGQYSPGTPDLYVATGFNKWGMTSSMVAAGILTDLVAGRKNLYAPIFAPDRSLLRPQLFRNAAESTWNLVRPTAPRCPHLGCALHWNKQEHSWDCSCHGSRFSEEGTLLDGPATGDLPK